MWPFKSPFAVWLLAAVLSVAWGCAELLTPLGARPAAVPAGYVRASIRVQMPTPKVSGLRIQATNDLRNQTLPAKMRLTVTGLDILSPIEPSGDHVNPVPLSSQTATVSMLVPLGRNLVITAEGLTIAGEPIPSAVVKGVFDATVDQGTVTATVNRLTTPVAETIESLIAKQHLGPDEQKRSRNLLLSFDTAPLQTFVLQQLLGGTGNLATDLARFDAGTLLKHPGLINTAALAKYLWEKAAVPPNANFLVDDQGRGAFLTPGRVKGTISGVGSTTKVTILCDDPVSKPLTVEGSTSFDLGSVQPGRWRVHAHASGFKTSVVHYSGSGEPPSFYEAGDVPAGGERRDMDFALDPIPPTVDRVEPARGPFSPSLSNPAYLTIHGQDFGSAQDNAVIVFRNLVTGATVAANLIDSWSESRIRVVVPTLTTGDYAVRIDKPTLIPGQFIIGQTTGTYAAGTWKMLFNDLALPFTQGNPMAAKSRRLGIATSDDLHVFAHLFVGWDSILAGFKNTVISLGQGAIKPAAAFGEVNTTTPAGSAWALHPDGRSLYVWGASGGLKARAFGVSGSPIGAVYDLPAPQGVTPSDCGAEGAVFDRDGTLHLAFRAHPSGIYYQRWRIDGLGVATPMSPPQRLDGAANPIGSQDPPRVRLGRGGHALLTWIDRRAGFPDHYLRMVGPNGQPAYDEIKVSLPIDDLGVDSQGHAVLSGQNASSINKLVDYRPDGVLAGETTVPATTGSGVQRLARILFDSDDHLIACRTWVFNNWMGTNSGYHTQANIQVLGYVRQGAAFVEDAQRPAHSAYMYNTYNNEPIAAPETYMFRPVLGPDGTLSLGYMDYATKAFRVVQYGWW